jgi:hypothetical protein
MKKTKRFYYANKEGVLQGLAMRPENCAAFEKITKDPFDILPYEVYWKKIARYMATHAPQGYIMWDGVSYWVIGNCAKILGDNKKEIGVNVIQINPDKSFGYQWFTFGKEEWDSDADEPDPTYTLVFDPWDWNLEGEGDDEMFELSEEQINSIFHCNNWTDELHAEYAEKFPPEKYWE